MTPPKPSLLKTCFTKTRLGLAQEWSWRFDPRAAESVRRVRAFRDKHAGERCFVMGNGPSLKKTDLSLLKNEKTFGLNRIYLMFDDLGFATTYLVCINQLVVEQSAAEIARAPCPKFVSWKSRDLLDFAPDMMFVRSGFLPGFQTDVTRRVFEGCTVTYMAMQIAFYMGFEEVIIIGVDHSFATKGPKNAEVTSQGDDPNHFHPGYFGKGFRWNLPDLEGSEQAYRMAKTHYEKAGRRIVDATVGGKLEVYPKVDYGSLF